MQADLTLVAAADGGRKFIFGSSSNMGNASSPAFLKTLSDCSGPPPVLSTAVAARTDGAPARLASREDASFASGNSEGDLTRSNRRLDASVADSASTGRAQSDPVGKDCPDPPSGSEGSAADTATTTPGGVVRVEPSAAETLDERTRRTVGAQQRASLDIAEGAVRASPESRPAAPGRGEAHPPDDVADDRRRSTPRPGGRTDPMQPGAATPGKTPQNAAGLATLVPVAESQGDDPIPPDASGCLRNLAPETSGRDTTTPSSEEPPAASVTEEGASKSAKGTSPDEVGRPSDFTAAFLRGATPPDGFPDAEVQPTPPGRQTSVPSPVSPESDPLAMESPRRIWGLSARGGNGAASGDFRTAEDEAGNPATNVRGAAPLFTQGNGGVRGEALEPTAPPETTAAAHPAGRYFTGVTGSASKAGIAVGDRPAGSELPDAADGKRPQAAPAVSRSGAIPQPTVVVAEKSSSVPEGGTVRTAEWAPGEIATAARAQGADVVTGRDGPSASAALQAQSDNTEIAGRSDLPPADPPDDQRATSADVVPGTDAPPNGPAHRLAASRGGDPTAPANGRSDLPAADPPDGQRAASAVEFPDTDQPSKEPGQRVAANRGGEPPALAKDGPASGNIREGLASVSAGAGDGTAEGSIRAGFEARPEAATGGLPTPNSKPQVESPATDGDVAARPSAGVSAAPSPTTESETAGGDAGDQTADNPAPRPADSPPAADKPLFASVDQRAFVEILESAGHTKASQGLPPSVPTGLVKQLVERAALSIKEGASEIRIALKPEVLGHLQMEITTENHQVAVKVIAETHLAKALLDQNLAQLKHHLQEQGLLMDKFEVLVAQDSSQFASGRQSAGGYAQAQRTNRNNAEPETGAGTRQDREAAPRREREGNARIDYFA